MTEPSKTIFIIDATGYLKNAFQVNPVNISGREPGSAKTAAIKKMQSTISILSGKIEFQYAACVFDSKSLQDSNFYEGGKIDAVSLHEQVPSIMELLKNLGWPVLDSKKSRAIDVIASITSQAEKMGLNIIVCSYNLVFAQLISNQTKFIFRMRDCLISKSQLSDAGIKPENIPDYLAMLNDEQMSYSDPFNPTERTGVKPKIPGIGVKMAISLLRKYGSLHEIFKHAHTEVESKIQNLLKHKDQLISDINRLTLDNQLDISNQTKDIDDLEALLFIGKNYPALEQFYKNHEFTHDSKVASLGFVKNKTVSKMRRLLAKENIPSPSNLTNKFAFSSKYNDTPVVYVIKSVKTGQIYIGSTNNLQRRSINHLQMLEAHAHANFKLNDDYQKYGRANFELRVLAVLSTLQEAREREQLYLSIFWGRANCYNESAFSDESKMQKLGLWIIVAQLINKQNTKSSPLGSAIENGYGRYLTTHAAAKDLKLSKRLINIALADGDGMVDGWKFSKTKIYPKHLPDS